MEFYTLNILAERVIRKLSGGDIPNDSPYDKAFVRMDVQDALNEDLKLVSLTNRGSGLEDDKSHLTMYIATYPNIPLEKETSTGREFFALPNYFVSLPRNKGIHAVHPQFKINQMDAQPMIRILNQGVNRKLPTRTLEGKNWGYYMEGMKGFTTRSLKRDEGTHVTVKLILAGAVSGPDEVLPLIPDSVSRIIDLAAQRVLNRYPQDRLVDNNPNIRPINQ